MIKLENISKKYGKNYVLNNISLSVYSGMNFIVGASGSGKSTLLKIMSGIDDEYEGEAYLYDKNIKNLSKNDKSFIYNDTLGFIWQEFNLIDDYTVLENILLPTNLKEDLNINKAKKLISDLNLKSVMDKKVKFLSGGQKQRVAIARELMKNPKIILADEPTSALDNKSSKDIIKILREISKEITVVIITHDTSHILNEDTVFTLNKGELISQKNNDKNLEKYLDKDFKPKKTNISFKNVTSIIKTNILSNKNRFLVSSFSIFLGVCFLLTTITNSISSKGQSAFDDIFDMYGKQVLDIGVYSSFVGASETNENLDENPNVDISQDINGLYDKYLKDDRVEFITYLQQFDNINVEFDKNSYSVNSSGYMPIINEIIAGRMPNSDEKEVVIPKSLVEKMGLTPADAIDKKIEFKGDITNHQLSKQTNLSVTICGVMDTNMITNYEGQRFENEIEDSFLFSKSALSDLLNQANLSIDKLNFLIRAKTPYDMISIKDELNKEGIVPIGNFEVIEDVVRLGSQSTKQSTTMSIFITLLAILMVGAISLIASILRKKEYAIFKISGFSNNNLRKLNLYESFTQMVFSLVFLIFLSPIVNIFTKKSFNVSIITFDNLLAIILSIVCLTLLNFVVTEIICEKTNILKTFKTGER